MSTKSKTKTGGNAVQAKTETKTGGNTAQAKTDQKTQEGVQIEFNFPEDVMEALVGLVYDEYGEASQGSLNEFTKCAMLELAYNILYSKTEQCVKSLETIKGEIGTLKMNF